MFIFTTEELFSFQEITTVRSVSYIPSGFEVDYILNNLNAEFSVGRIYRIENCKLMPRSISSKIKDSEVPFGTKWLERFMCFWKQKIKIFDHLKLNTITWKPNRNLLNYIHFKQVSVFIRCVVSSSVKRKCSGLYRFGTSVYLNLDRSRGLVFRQASSSVIFSEWGSFGVQSKEFPSLMVGGTMKRTGVVSG